MPQFYKQPHKNKVKLLIPLSLSRSLTLWTDTNYWAIKNPIDMEVKTVEHRSYITGVILAHEFFHQIVGKSALFLNMYCGVDLKSKDNDGGHCRNDRNLMFPGDGLQNSKSSPIDWTTDEKKHFTGNNSSRTSAILYATGDFFPLKDLPATSPWERISPTFKYIVSMAMLLYEIELKYGPASNVFSCAKILVKKDLSNIQYNSYEVVK